MGELRSKLLPGSAVSWLLEAATGLQEDETSSKSESLPLPYNKVCYHL